MALHDTGLEERLYYKRRSFLPDGEIAWKHASVDSLPRVPKVTPVSSFKGRFAEHSRAFAQR
jgi:hypothetical protein